MSILVLVLDLVGTFVFALSGGIAAVRHRLDLFGILVLSFLAANCGGILRDVLIGAVPPAGIADWRYRRHLGPCGIAGLSFGRRLAFHLGKPLLVFDGAGLALFAVSGALKALEYPRSAGGRRPARRADRHRRRHRTRHPRQRDSDRAGGGPVRGGRVGRRGGGGGGWNPAKPSLQPRDCRRLCSCVSGCAWLPSVAAGTCQRRIGPRSHAVRRQRPVAWKLESAPENPGMPTGSNDGARRFSERPFQTVNK